MKRNKFKRALHHLNKKHVVESAPTNSTLGVFSITPSGVGPVGWTDREFTTDISGNPLPKLQTADFTVGDSPADSTEALDTSGLFAEDGTILTQTPPGDNSYILGPFSSMWYAWGNFTTLGYIRQSDRRMVNLGTITGKLSDWDGSSINSYGSLTLEQALWFRDVEKFGGIDNDPANHNFRARYPGPPSNTPDAFGRYLCVIAAGRNAGGTETRPAPPINATVPGEMNSDDNLSAILNRLVQTGRQRALGAFNSVRNFLGNATESALGWVNNTNQALNNAISNSVPTAIGRAIRSLTDPMRYAGQMMFQGNPAGRTAGLSNYWSPDPRTAGTYSRTGNLRGIPGAKPGPGGTITTAPRPKNMPKVSRSVLGQPQFKFPKGTSVSNMVTQVADDAAVSAAGRVAATKASSRLGKIVPFVGTAIAVADATNRIRNGDYGGAILSGLSAIPGPLGWAALGTQIVTDSSGVTGGKRTRKEEYLLESNLKSKVKDAVKKSGGFDLEVGDWGAAFMDELNKTKDLDDDEKAIIASVFAGNTDGLMVADFQQVLGKIMVRIANKEFKGNRKGVKEEFLSESKKKVIREIKKPILIPEAKKKYRVKPKVIGHPSNKTLSNQMKDPEPTPAFKKEVPIWSMDQKMRNARESQEKKNEVLEYLGSSSDHWNYMTKAIKEHNKKVIKLNYGGKTKKVTRKEQVDNDYLVFMEDDDGNKSSMLQSKINETQSDEADKELFAKYYEMHPVKKKSLFKEVVKRGVFDYKGKPSKKGYPDKEPAQLDPQTGMHPEYGKKVKHDKIDSSTAESMPMQGDPEIDANIAKNINPEQKKRKMKILSQPNG